MNGTASFKEIVAMIEEPLFVIRVVMSEIDTLMHKFQLYASLATQTSSKRERLAERARLQVEGLRSFPEPIARQSKMDPQQLAEANSILTEEAMFAQLRAVIEARFNTLVGSSPIAEIRALAEDHAFRSGDYSALEALLVPGTLDSRRKELLVAVEAVESGLRGEARREIREHLYGTLLVFSSNPRVLMDTLRFNYMIMGPPGTGKSHLSRVMATFFNSVGIFCRREMVNVKTPDLVAPYVGQSAAKTRRAVYGALETVFFLDEAYALLSCEYQTSTEGRRTVKKRDQYGLEAVDQLVDMMTELKGCICFIFAGYEEEMEQCFLETNKGLRRRFATKWKLKPYETEDLVEIFVDILQTKDAQDHIVFKEERRVFEDDQFTPERVGEVAFPVLQTLVRVAALPNQAGDIERIAEKVYESLSLQAGSRVVTLKDIAKVVNSFLSETVPGVKILGVSQGSVRVIDALGVTRTFQNS